MKAPAPRFRAMIPGFPKAGKSGAIVPLVEAGFDVLYADFDGNPETVLNLVGDRENFSYLPFEDKVRASRLTEGVSTLAGLSGEPKAYFNYMNFLETGQYVSPDGKTKEKFDPMINWGPETILVTDSSTKLIEAIWNRFLYIIGKTSRRKQDWGAIVNELSYVFDMINSVRNSFHSIVIAHLQTTGDMEMEEDPKNDRSELVKFNNTIKEAKNELVGVRIFPRAVTKAQSENIASKFPIILPAEIDDSGRRIFNLQPRKELAVAVPVLAGRKLPRTLPTETGLLDIFEAVVGYREPVKE